MKEQQTAQTTGQDSPEPTPEPKAKAPLDPLRRVFIPIEKVMTNGNFRFRTLDRTRYTRDGTTGAIRRADPKPLTKKQRRELRG
jgi:hypothetical protein